MMRAGRTCLPRRVRAGVVSAWLLGGPAAASSPIPREAHLLPRSRIVIADDAGPSISLYRVDDGSLIRTLPCGARVTDVDTTPDEKHLATACDDGGIGVWEVATGRRLWWRDHSGSGLDYIFDVSFSGDGKSLVACNYSDFVAIFDARTGARIGRVGFPSSAEKSIVSADLSPDGRRGAFRDGLGQLFTFETASGEIRNTGLTCEGLLRYSSDGQYLAMESEGAYPYHLRVVRVADGSMLDVGQFDSIGRIEPTGDGLFMASAYAINESGPHVVESGPHVVGVILDPASGRLTEAWRLPLRNAETRTDFDADRMIGVATSRELITKLIDLRTGLPLWTVDGKARHLPQHMPPAGANPLVVRRWLLAASVVALVAAACGALLVVPRRRPNDHAEG